MTRVPVRDSGPRVTSVDVAGPLCTAYSAIAAHQRTPAPRLSGSSPLLPALLCRFTSLFPSCLPSLFFISLTNALSLSVGETFLLCISRFFSSPRAYNSVRTTLYCATSPRSGASPLTDSSGRTSHRISSSQAAAIHLRPKLLDSVANLREQILAQEMCRKDRVSYSSYREKEMERLFRGEIEGWEAKAEGKPICRVASVCKKRDSLRHCTTNQ